MFKLILGLFAAWLIRLMPIAGTDVHYRLSGGAANNDPNASLGGARSTTTDAGSNIFDDVSGAESAAGRTEYRGVYVSNEHATLTYQGVRAWTSTDTPSADTDADLALAAEAVNTQMASIGSETTAPSGVTFTNAAVSFATGLVIGDIPATQWKGVWLKRVVTAGAAAAADSFTVSAQGDTNP
jgi:hypothetical protein